MTRSTLPPSTPLASTGELVVRLNDGHLGAVSHASGDESAVANGKVDDPASHVHLFHARGYAEVLVHSHDPVAQRLPPFLRGGVLVARQLAEHVDERHSSDDQIDGGKKRRDDSLLIGFDEVRLHCMQSDAGAHSNGFALGEIFQDIGGVFAA